MDALRLSTLEAVWAQRPASANSVARRYRDFVIDGVPVSSMVRIDVISPFGWAEVDDEELEALQRLLGRAPPDLPHGRTSLYVCPECGDLGCTAVSILVEFEPDRVVWKAFGYQNNYDGTVQLDPLSQLGPFIFRRPEYENAVEALMGRDRGGV
jgi:hypothetical protein